ncbi:hypothetical protein BFP70_14045 [Thioclava sp. SK-1]|nr:hypothetical protein BFP70_14045 [Thioclava sp. SK-1]
MMQRYGDIHEGKTQRPGASVQRDLRHLSARLMIPSSMGLRAQDMRRAYSRSSLRIRRGQMHLIYICLQTSLTKARDLHALLFLAKPCACSCTKTRTLPMTYSYFSTCYDQTDGQEAFR